MNKKQRLLLITSSFPRWENDDTTGRYMLEIARELNRDYEVHVLAPHTRLAKKEEIMDGVQVHRHRQTPIRRELAYGSGLLSNLRSSVFNPLLLPFFILFQFLAIKKLVREKQIDVINPHWIVPQGFLAVVYKIIFCSSVPIVATAHGSDINSLNGNIGTFVKKFTLSRLSGLIVVSDQLRDRVRLLGYQGPLTVASMGVDTTKFNPDRKASELRPPGSGPFLIYVGALIETKGLRYLINALPGIIKVFPKACLWLIGEGALQNDLKQMASERGVIDHVRFLGSQDHREIPRYLASADLFILPSFAEGFSVGVAEALSSGLPVVMTERIGIADAIHRILKTQGESSFLTEVPVRSAVSLENAIIHLLQNPEILVTLKPRGRKFVVENYDWSIVGLRHRQAITNALSSKP